MIMIALPSLPSTFSFLVARSTLPAITHFCTEAMSGGTRDCQQVESMPKRLETSKDSKPNLGRYYMSVVLTGRYVAT